MYGPVYNLRPLYIDFRNSWYNYLFPLYFITLNYNIFYFSACNDNIISQKWRVFGYVLFVHETRQDALSGGIDVEVTALVLLVNWNLTLLIYKPAHVRTSSLPIGWFVKHWALIGRLVITWLCRCQGMKSSKFPWEPAFTSTTTTSDFPC